MAVRFVEFCRVDETVWSCLVVGGGAPERLFFECDSVEDEVVLECALLAWREFCDG